jgi:hypothetical protein
MTTVGLFVSSMIRVPDSPKTIDFYLTTEFRTKIANF